MVATVTSAVMKVKTDLKQLLGQMDVNESCRRLGHAWRDRKLPPAATVEYFVRQVLEGNTAIAHVTHWGETEFTPSSYCDSRARLPLKLFVDFGANVRDRLAPTSPGEWLGHRVLFVDGSSFSMPDTPELQRAFGQPGGQAQGCGFPVARLLALFCAHTGMIKEAIPLPLRSHEQSSVADLHGQLQAGDVLVADRGFCSFVHVALLQSRGVHAVFRLHQKVVTCPNKKKGSMQSRVEVLNEGDELVEWRRPKRPPAWMSREDFQKLPETLRLRIVRYRTLIPGQRTREVTLVTTLVDPKSYSAPSLADLYATRWRCELHLRELKQTLGMDVLKCKTVDGILKELNVFCLVYNLVRAVMVEAARQKNVPVWRLSFIDTLRWLRTTETLPPLLRILVNPDRPGRFEPRVRKRRPKQYPLLQKPRASMKQSLLRQSLVP
jgi:hypothetical protein